jgi:ribonuclease HII
LRQPSKTSEHNLWQFEREAWAQGHEYVAGIDEAGRGPLAGPVVAACVVLSEDFCLSGIDDSKKLSEKQRERAFGHILKEARAVGIGMMEAAEIDRINILRATHAAMLQAVLSLSRQISPTVLLIDGRPVPGLPCPNQQAIVGGDSRSASIAAASIVAKVTRDRLMTEIDAAFPEYGFARHKGYGSQRHLLALQTYGPCPIHRRSFAPVAVLCRPQDEQPQQ